MLGHEWPVEAKVTKPGEDKAGIEAHGRRLMTAVSETHIPFKLATVTIHRSLTSTPDRRSKVPLTAAEMDKIVSKVRGG